MQKVFLDGYGEKYRIGLQKYRCSQCGELFVERPDCFIGRKQYLREYVDAIQAGDELPKNTGPSRTTAFRWRKETENL